MHRGPQPTPHPTLFAIPWLALALILGGCPAPADPGVAGPVDPAKHRGGGAGGGSAPGDAPIEDGGGPASHSATIPPGSGHQVPSEFANAGDDAVTLSGTITYEGAYAGTLTLDFMGGSGGVDGAGAGGEDEAGGEDGGPAPGPARVVHSEKLDGPGAFSVKAPRNFGVVSCHAFMDINANGPSPGEPMGMGQEITIGETDIDGIVITVLDEPPEPAGGELPPEPGAGQPPTDAGAPPPEPGADEPPPPPTSGPADAPSPPTGG